MIQTPVIQDFPFNILVQEHICGTSPGTVKGPLACLMASVEAAIAWSTSHHEQFSDTLAEEVTCILFDALDAHQLL